MTIITFDPSVLPISLSKNILSPQIITVLLTQALTATMFAAAKKRPKVWREMYYRHACYFNSLNLPSNSDNCYCSRTIGTVLNEGPSAENLE